MKLSQTKLIVKYENDTEETFEGNRAYSECEEALMEHIHDNIWPEFISDGEGNEYEWDLKIEIFQALKK